MQILTKRAGQLESCTANLSDDTIYYNKFILSIPSVFT